MNKTVDIFYKSYAKDFWLLRLSLETIKKNVTGYNQIIILIPEQEKDLFDTRNLPERTLVFYVNEYGKGWLYQQWCKMNAYNYCYAEFILFADSDCIWDHKIDLQEFVANGNPEILYTDYRQLPDAIIWKEPTERFIKGPVDYEFMRRNCMVYYRQHLIDIASYEPNLEKIIMSSERFSEFNAIGAFVYKYKRTCYTWVNTDDWTYVPPKAQQIWSHSSKAEGASELHLREYIRTVETIAKAFGVPLP